ncbi:PLD nuclease N-terminal domain-containing protein [Aliarcobacter skirrowii]|uniref:PLD nuclease N-terminal domain-containing protein n=1 Tax=Aliarcobacter skirrowii TaxID=28200 RepID=UPI0021B1D2FB|nr:PLD nuclease N-terminal domain-containing protein [Aliarcobacter skirrowii]MCT7445737.1 PLD nuclease N-terminal domain-containing protein [Aliarcobacter skirrowii]
MVLPSGIQLLVISLIVLWIYTLIDVLRNDFKSSINKLIWIIVILFLAQIGSILYLIFGRKQRIRKER